MSDQLKTRTIVLLDEWGYPWATAGVPLAQHGSECVSWQGRIYRLGGCGDDGRFWYRLLQPVAVEGNQLREYSPPPEVPLTNGWSEEMSDAD